VPTVTDVLQDLQQELRAAPERAAGLTATYDLHLEGEEGGDWHLLFADGVSELRPGPAERPDTTLQMAAGDFVALRTGRLDGATAFARGLLRVSGDAALGLRLSQLMRRGDGAPPVTPQPITRVAAGFMAAKHLFVANELDVFAHLADGPLPVEELATRAQAPVRTLRIVLDALVGLELLERRDGRYANTPETDLYLTGRGPRDFRPALRFWNRVSYPRWQQLETVVRTERGVGFAPNADSDELHWHGMAAITQAGARALAGAYDFGRHRALLDLGGGDGTFGGEVLLRHPGLRSTLLELPAVARLAAARLAQHPARDRITVEPCDLTADELPHCDHDLVLVANVLHVFVPEQNVALLRKIATAVRPGTRLLLVDTWTDATRSGPLQTALLSGEYLVANGGQAFSVTDAAEWLDRTGWKLVEDKPVLGVTGLVVGERRP